MFVYKRIPYLLFSGEWEINGSSPVAVVGTDFVLTCTIPQNSGIPLYVAWLRATVVVFIDTNNCKADINKWPTYTYTCNNTVFTLTIPGDGIDPDTDNNISWRCSNGGKQNSEPIIITVLSNIYFSHLLCVLLYSFVITIIACSFLFREIYIDTLYSIMLWN